MQHETFWPGGQAPKHFQPGDFLLTRTQFRWRDPGSLDGPMISFGQSLRYQRKYCWANHAALVVNEQGGLIEAKSKGVIFGDAKTYRELDYYLIDPWANFADDDWVKHQRADAVRYAQLMLDTKYGWLTDMSLGITFLTGLRFVFGKTNTVICSGLVAAAIGDPEWRADPSHVPPAQLAEHYDVTFREVR
jgi:hypothetical protein